MQITSFSKFLLSIMLTCVGIPSLAKEMVKLQGAVDGGGGKAIVWRSASGEILKVKLLDLWEAETLYDLKPKLFSESSKEIVKLSIGNLKNSYELNLSMSLGPNKSCRDQECVAMLLNDTSELFFQPSSRLKWLRGVELTLTNDSYELAKPEGGKIEQVVNYRPEGKVLVNLDIFEKMPVVDQAALILHEGYYSFLRRLHINENNSIRTRRAIGYVMSGQAFQLYSKPEFGGHSFCETEEPPSSPTNIIFYATGNPQRETELAVYIGSMHGSKLIGEKQPLMSFDFGKEVFEGFLKGGPCPEGDSSSMIQVFGKGPVEFDHEIKLEWKCEYNQRKFFLIETKPGESSKISNLKCHYRSQ